MGEVNEPAEYINTVNVYEQLGRIAYEAAAEITDCKQPWSEANQEKWIAAALAVREHDLKAAMTERIPTDDEIIAGDYSIDNVLALVHRFDELQQENHELRSLQKK